ncbi:MAG: MBL fold metallo-hydrolase, partial [Limnochordales bacterium]
MAQAATVEPKLAASVILVRAPLRVYMTRRSEALRFAGGYHVFPGGAVDPQDVEVAARRPGELAAVGLPPGQEACVAAALRELFEEAGVLLGRDEGGAPLWQPAGEAAHRDGLREARRRLLADEVSWEEVLAEHGWRLAGERLAYMGRWVTPPAARRRFDTYFFMADLTGGIEPEPSGGEVALGEWLAPAAALERAQAGEMLLMRPTRSWLEILAECASAADAWARFSGPGARREAVYEANTPEVLRSVLEAQGVWLVPVPSPTLLPATTTNVYLVAHSGEALLIDAGHGGPAGVELVREAWRRAGCPQVQAILLTHGHQDHSGSVVELAAAFQCPALYHPAGGGPGAAKGDSPTAGRAAAVEWRPITEGTTIPVGRHQLEVLH